MGLLEAHAALAGKTGHHAMTAAPGKCRSAITAA